MNTEGLARRCASPRLQQPVDPKAGARQKSASRRRQRFLTWPPRPRSTGLVGVGLLVSALSLSGCSSAPPLPTAYVPVVEKSELPELDDVDIVRDEVARAESSISERASTLASLAVECEACDAALLKSAGSAQERLDLAGGLWDPWGEFSDSEESDTFVVLPAEVGEAPFTVNGLVAFTAETASEQLMGVAALPSDFAEEREALGAILVGRLGAAHALAHAFGTQVAAVAPLSAEATSVYAPSDPDPSEEETLGEGVTASGSPESGEAPQAEAPASGEQSQVGPESGASNGDDAQSGGATRNAEDRVGTAVAKLDCARSTLLTLPVEEEEVGGILSFASTLENRNRALLKAGAPDTRSLRCLSGATSVAELLEEIASQDLIILSNGEPDVAAAAAEGLVEALVAWVAFSPETLPTVTLWPDAKVSSGGEDE